MIKLTLYYLLVDKCINIFFNNLNSNFKQKQFIKNINDIKIGDKFSTVHSVIDTTNSSIKFSIVKIECILHNCTVNYVNNPPETNFNISYRKGTIIKTYNNGLTETHNRSDKYNSITLPFKSTKFIR